MNFVLFTFNTNLLTVNQSSTLLISQFILIEASRILWFDSWTNVDNELNRVVSSAYVMDLNSLLDLYILLSPDVLYGWVLRASNLWKNKNFEYAHQILDYNDIEPPIFENHNRMQTMTSFAYRMHTIKFWVCNVMY